MISERKVLLNRCLNDISLLDNDYLVSGFCFKSAQNSFICQHCYYTYLQDAPDLVLRFIQVSKAYPTVTKGCYFGNFSVKNLWNSLVVPSFNTNDLLKHLVSFWDFLDEQPKNAYYHHDYNDKKKLHFCKSFDLTVCSGCYQGTIIHSSFEPFFGPVKITDDEYMSTHEDATDIYTCAFEDSRILSEFTNYAKLNDWKSFTKVVLDKRDNTSENFFRFVKSSEYLFCNCCYSKYFKFSKFDSLFSIVPDTQSLINPTCIIHELDLHSYLKICLPAAAYKIENFIKVLQKVSKYPPCVGDALVYDFYNISPTRFNICAHCYLTKWQPVLDSFPNLEIQKRSDPRGVYCNFNLHSTENDIGYKNYQISRIIKQAFHSFDNGDTILDYSRSIHNLPICDFFTRGIKSKKIYLLQSNTKNSANYAYACCEYCYLTFIKHTRFESMFVEESSLNYERDVVTNGPLESPISLSSNFSGLDLVQNTKNQKEVIEKNKLTCLFRIHEVQQQWYLSNMTHNLSFYVQICYFLRSLLNSKYLFEKLTSNTSSEVLGDQLLTNQAGYVLSPETQRYIKSGFASNNKMQKYELNYVDNNKEINIATSEYFDGWLRSGKAMKKAITAFESTLV